MNTAKRMDAVGPAAAIPGSRLDIFADCGHSAYWERPDLFNQTVLDFIGQTALRR